MEQFHPSDLAHGSKFRDVLRYKQGFTENTTNRLDHAQGILERALGKHGEEVLTKGNFGKVMEHARKDPAWKHLGSGGDVFETELRTRVGIEEEPTLQ